MAMTKRRLQRLLQVFRSPKRRPARRTLLHLEALERRETPASFTAGNLAVLELAGTNDNTSGSILELSPSTASQSPVQTISIASTGSNALRFSDSGTSSFLSDSNDGTQLVLAAYNTTDSTTANLDTTGPTHHGFSRMPSPLRISSRKSGSSVAA
jgi:hypothetical protein